MKSPSEETRLGYIPAVDGLRAVAILCVIAYHLWPSALPGGFVGVDVFFAISGFVVTGSLADKRFNDLKSLLTYFYARRMVRILPALLAMLLATTLATQLLVPEAWLSSSVPQVGESAFFGLSNIVLALDSDTYFGPHAGFNPFLHSWSLGVEEQFYLAFPFILFWHQRLGARAIGDNAAIRLVAGLSLASLAASAALTAIDHKLGFYLLPSRFWELGAGVLLWLTGPAWQPRLARWGAAAVAALAVGGAALIAIGLAVPESAGFPFPLAMLPVAGTVALIAAVTAAPTRAPARLLGARPMVAIGRLSYSLYLWHWPVFVLLHWTVGIEAIGAQAAAIALTVTLATASYRLIERPLRRSATLRALPRSVVIRRGMLAASLAAVAGLALVLAHDRISLSVTRDHAAWYADSRHPLDPRISHCRLAETVASIAGGHVTSWTPHDCSVGPAGFGLDAVGDSHVQAYTPALRQLAAELGVPVRAYFRPGCPHLRLTEMMDPLHRCAGYYAAVLADMQMHGRPGDVLFLPGLRLLRFVNQFDHDPALLGERHDLPLPAAMAEARAVLGAVARSGFVTLFEAPKPLVGAPPFRCADAFNRGNPICAGGFDVSRARLETMRGPVVAAMHGLSAEVPGVRVWDPFPLLCPAEPCRAFDAQGPLFFDGDHLSGHGNDILYPSLRAAVAAAARSSVQTRSISRSNSASTSS